MDSTERLAHLRLRMFEYEFDIFHHAKMRRQSADALSRLPTTGEDYTPLEDDLSILAIDVPKKEKEIRILMPIATNSYLCTLNHHRQITRHQTKMR